MVEWRQPIANFARRISKAQVIHGDIVQDATIKQVAKVAPMAQTILAGVSCQPYSKAGDYGSGGDQRAGTLPATLRAAMLMGAHCIILECVGEAKTDPFVQSTIQKFCKATGFKVCQRIHKLSEIWASRRDRWWCVLTSQVIGQIVMQAPASFPAHQDVGQVMPCAYPCTQADLSQLLLTEYEVRNFESYSQGLQNLVLRLKGPMATALHSWGNQVYPCRCTCRSQGFTIDRLEKRGLWSPFIWVNLEEGRGAFRHFHPAEAAMLCGVDPCIDWGTDLRLALSIVGQIASPLQSGWVFAALHQHVVTKCGATSRPSPQQVVEVIKTNLLQQASRVFIPQNEQDIARESQKPPFPVLQIMVTCDQTAVFPVMTQPFASVQSIAHAQAAIDGVDRVACDVTNGQPLPKNCPAYLATSVSFQGGNIPEDPSGADMASAGTATVKHLECH